MRIGGSDISALYVGAQSVSAGYLGGSLLFPATISGIGYLSETLTSTLSGGQWYADGVPLAGETSTTYTVTSENDGASFTYRIAGVDSNQIHNWTPEDIATSYWFDAADTSTITESSSFTSVWADKSGNNRNATQTGATTTRPRTGVATLNGRNVLDFGTQRWFTIPQTNTGVTVMLVATDSPLNTGQLTGAAPSTFAPTWDTRTTGVSYRGSTTQTFGHSVNNNGFSSGIITLNDPTNTVNYYSISGTQGATSQSLTSASLRVNTIGRDFAGGVQYAGCEIAEIVVMSTIATTDQIERLQGYTAWKWGFVGFLPSDHPYKTTAPTV